MTSILELIQDLLIKVLDAKNSGRKLTDRELEIIDNIDEVIGGLMNE